MKCPKCGNENNDSAKFCKKCGTPLNNMVSQENMADSTGGEKSNNDNTKIIIAVLVVVAIVLAGAFIYLYGFNNDQGTSDNAKAQESNMQQTVESISNNTTQSSEPAQATQTQQTTQATQATHTPMTIKSGSFSTGSAEEDKTYASIYVGKEHAGEDVTVQIFYSRDGNSLNHGNMVPVSVHSDGYLEVASADAYHYYPDYATINLFDSSGNLMDTRSVSLSPSSGTQTFS